MNYYEHHIGDYAEATAHLSFIEDAAYTRLIRKYYSKEAPIPAEISSAQRLVAARTKEEKEAVAAVLQEFFELRDDGWHQSKCDEVIAAYKAGEPEREVKKTNENIRLRNHRQERAQLFASLNAAGQHAQWNIPIAELRERVANLQQKTATETATPETQTETATATPATATHIPIPTTHTPLPITSEKKPARKPRAPSPEITLSEYLDRCKAEGVKPIPVGHPIRTYCQDAGITDEMRQVCWLIFKERHLEGDKPKKQKDWPTTFANCVKARWYQLWFVNAAGEAEWTSTGLQAKRVIEAEHARKEQQLELA